MGKLPLTRPIYMRELGRRMGMTAREARTQLRKLERSRRVKLIFDSRTTMQGRLWTTEALLAKHCPELVDRPRRALGEVRTFVSRVSAKIEDLRKEIVRVEAKHDQELSELRVALEELE